MYERALNATLATRLRDESRHTIQIVIGPRQVGKTTSVQQVLDSLGMPVISGSADTPGLQAPAWMGRLWAQARQAHAESGRPVVLFIDEVQKVSDWSAWVKTYWDEDTWHQRDVRVVLTGSSSLLMQQGLSESLAGRYEKIPATHWLWPECRDAFGWDLDTYIYYGGYPGGAQFIGDEKRWRGYISDITFETAVSRDVLLMARVDKPALLRQVFELACAHAGQELSYEKFVGQLQDAGNTTTVAHYLDLLDGAWLVRALQKYSAEAVRRRRSSPKLAPYSTAMVTGFGERTFADARADESWWGRLVEVAVGARLLADATVKRDKLHYWRKRVGGVDLEVDFVYASGSRVTAIEVKTSGYLSDTPGLQAFRAAHPEMSRCAVAGPGGVSVESLLENGIDALA